MSEYESNMKDAESVIWSYLEDQAISKPVNSAYM